MDDLKVWLQIGAYALFAALGGLMGYIMRTVDAGKKIKIERALLEGVAAGFVGLIVMFACQAMGLSPQWTGVIVGVCGWLGANASIRLVELLVYKRLGLQKEKQETKDDQDVP